MGIFKNLFKKDIAIDEKQITSLVTKYPLNNNKIKMNTRIILPNGYFAVFGSCGKVLDVISINETIVSPATLPKCCKKLKIHNLDKNKKPQKNFKTDLYYVSNQEKILEIKSQDKAEMGNMQRGIFSCGISFKFVFSIVNVESLMDFLLCEFDFIKTGEVEKIVYTYASDCAINALFKNNFAITELVQIHNETLEIIKNAIIKKMNKIGINVIEISNIKYILPKKYRAEFEKNYQILQKKQENSQNLQNNDTNNVENQKTDSVENNAGVEINADNCISQETSVVDTNCNIEENIDCNISVEETQNEITESENMHQKQNCDCLLLEEQEKDCGSQDVLDNEEKFDCEQQNLNQENVSISESEIAFESTNEVKKTVFEQVEESNKNQKSNYKYVPFGDFVINEKTKNKKINSVLENNGFENLKQDNNLNTQNNENNLYHDEVLRNSIMNMQKEKSKKEFVDLNVEHLYQKNTKRHTNICLNCGAENDENALFCNMCGKKLI